MRRFVKRGFRFCAILAFAAAVFLWITNLVVLSAASGKVYLSSKEVPNTQVGLVLGTTPRIHRIKNLFFEVRMDAAASLYHSGRVKKLLVSGDNSTPYYDEPTAMRKALVARGVPARDVVLDYAGLRTLDSVVRAHRIFGVKRCVIITDDFHLPRALYIAQNEGLDAVGFQSRTLPVSVSPRTYLREVGARSLVWVDLHLLNRGPKFLGPRETVLASKD